MYIHHQNLNRLLIVFALLIKVCPFNFFQENFIQGVQRIKITSTFASLFRREVFSNSSVG